jgi:hypothetical protein
VTEISDLAGLVRRGLVFCGNDACGRARVGRRDSRTDLARRRNPSSHAASRVRARSGRECSMSVEWDVTTAMGGHRANGPAPDTRR